MKQEFVNPFLTSAKLAWEKELGMDVELTSASAVDTWFLTEDITAGIGLSGQLVGTVLYGFPTLSSPSRRWANWPIWSLAMPRRSCRTLATRATLARPLLSRRRAPLFQR